MKAQATGPTLMKAQGNASISGSYINDRANFDQRASKREYFDEGAREGRDGANFHEGARDAANFCIPFQRRSHF